MNDNVLTIEVKPSGSRHRVTVLKGGEVVAMDVFNAGKAKDRNDFLTAVQKEYAGVDVQAADREILRQVNAEQTSAPAAETEETPEQKLVATPEAIRQEAEAMLTSPRLIEVVADDIAELGVAGERELTVTVYLVGTSRLLDEPAAAIVQGPSSSGKSYTNDKVTGLMPPEAVIRATKMTPQALFHMAPGSLKHRFISAGERSRLQDDEAAEATRALREMLSEQRLSKLMPVKVEGGRIETRKIEQEGPIAYVESTTQSQIFEEDLNRCVLLNTDERPEQTRRIIDRIAEAHSMVGSGKEMDRIRQKHHAAQRMLARQPVIVQFAGVLSKRFPAERVEARRAFGHFLRFVEASALLHQRQRKRQNGAILAALDDYQLVRHLLTTPLSRLLGRTVSDGANRLHERLRAQHLEKLFEAPHLAVDTCQHVRTINNYLGELHRIGWVQLIEPRKGPKAAVWRLAPDWTEGASVILPTIEEIQRECGFLLSDNTQVLTGEAVG
jgi:energy-coupling factor transporter ATP-binding protein EcfA2